MRVLVNNIHSTNATALIKMLKRIKSYKIEVWGTDTAQKGYIAASNMVDRYFQVPDINDEIKFFNFIKPLCENYEIDMVLVCSDKEVRFMSKYKNQINSIIINPSNEIVSLFSDKYKSSLDVEKLGIKIPPIVTDFFHAGKTIFRKKCSVSSLGIYVVDFSRESVIDNHFKDGWFAQKFIEGTTYIIDIFADKDGNPKLILPRRKLEVQNASAFRSQIINHKKIIELCKIIYNHYCIPGLSNIEFIEDMYGELYFIEINLRFGGSASAGIVASFNYIEQYLEHFVLNQKLQSLEYYMQYVGWGSVISRFYEECLFPSDQSHFKSYTQNDK